MMLEKPKKLLIVEDSEEISSLLQCALEGQIGVEVIVAENMAAAKLAIATHADSFFLAILDLSLPDAPQGEIVDYVISQSIPVIILTATNNDHIHELMMEKPILDYIVKHNTDEFQYITDLVDRLYNNADRKVLIVDDSKTSRLHLRSLLEQHNLNVYEACDGLEGLDVLKQHPDIMLIITEYNMPNMDGIDFIYKVREKYSRNELSIIGISTQDSNSLSVKLLKSGANDFLSRPFLHEEFYCRANQNIDTIKYYRQMREAAVTDYLTGLHNRKYLYDAGTKLFNNAKRGHISLTVGMIDIDFFKKINDEHGHHVGDLALKHISNIMQTQLRDGDIIARMGGEEFCILCVNLDPNHTSELFNRLRIDIMNKLLVVNEDLKIEMTVSIGIFEGEHDSLDAMINNADAALYDAKQSGRNRISHFSTIPTSE